MGSWFLDLCWLIVVVKIRFLRLRWAQTLMVTHGCCPYGNSRADVDTQDLDSSDDWTDHSRVGVCDVGCWADRALESFIVALRALIDSVNGTEAARKRLRDLADKVHRAAAAEAKADKKLLTHIAKGDKRLFRARRDAEHRSGHALVIFDGCTFRDGVLRLPGGTEIPMPAGIDTIEDVLATHRDESLTWSGAVPSCSEFQNN